MTLTGDCRVRPDNRRPEHHASRKPDAHGRSVVRRCRNTPGRSGWTTKF